MKIIIFLLTIQLLIHQNTGTPSKLNLEELFKKYLYRDHQKSDKFNLTNDYQLNVLRNRNNECLLRNYSKLNESKLSFTPINQTFIDLWRNFDDNTTNTSIIDYYFDNTCVSIDDLKKSILDDGNDLDDETIDILTRLIQIQSVNNGCDFCKRGAKEKVKRLDVWIYGIIFVTVINLSSLVGAIVIPCSDKKFYKKILMFLIALAIGTLAGSGFIHLIPEAHGITEDPKYSGKHEYVWKGLTIMGGAYLFYLVERIMKILISVRKNRLRKKLNRNEDQSPTMLETLENIGYVKPNQKQADSAVEMRTQILPPVQYQEEIPLNNLESNHDRHGHSHDVNKTDLTLVSPVAWMIIFGDGLHNFIDGLAIGVGFTESIYKGISICIAVICEEFPHELGDFAILINAGMTYKQALIFNALSACCCYFGLGLGILMGEYLDFINPWIYAIAGGMFVYISFCDMIPELNETTAELEDVYLKKIKNHNLLLLSSSESEEKSTEAKKLINVNSALTIYKFKLLFIQNIGIVLGFGTMVVIAMFEEKIESLIVR